ncbi:hypothetical protein M404DRAFT_745245 [Pisolithus tinctorius Marx 270]|uniref:Ubiquitin-like domain-containing protein n=1 Tax=Pisolithus tinctorius Marx 270 TaxID=870435 RepID=A0A0C3NIW6_PISTI|nr:hypothetical protein M404DRAFT_745245 [Pisolithus tinctorius Marx 270]
MASENDDVKPKLDLVLNYEGTRQRADITVKVKQNMPFQKIFDAAEKRFGKEPGTFKFVFEGKRLNPRETPASVGMENGDMIDAMLEQLGGGAC